jgi:hypothetical protein
MEAATKYKFLGIVMTGVTMSSHVNVCYGFSAISPKVIVEDNKEQQTEPMERIKFSVDGYNFGELSKESEMVTMEAIFPVKEDLQKNLQKLKEIEELKDNWNENGATKFSGKLIEKVKNVLYMLKEQPEIFPTAEGSIQLEYEKKDGQYLEINVYENHTNIFSIDSNEQEKEFEVKEDEVEKIKKIVEDFHERQ